MDNSQTDRKADSQEISEASSEEEFWNALDHVLSTQSPQAEKPGSRDSEADDFLNPYEKLTPRVRAVVEPFQELRDNSRFERSLNKLRAANRVELKTATRMARNQMKVDTTQREMDSTMMSLKSGYESDLKEMQGNYDDVKTLLYRKDKEIGRYGRMLYDQEVLLTTQRLGVTLEGPPVPNRFAKSAEAVEIEELREECARLRIQIESLKDMCSLYQHDAEVSKTALIDVKSQMKSQATDYDKVIRNLENSSAFRESELLEDKDSLQKQ